MPLRQRKTLTPSHLNGEETKNAYLRAWVWPAVGSTEAAVSLSLEGAAFWAPLSAARDGRLIRSAEGSNGAGRSEPTCTMSPGCSTKSTVASYLVAAAPLPRITTKGGCCACSAVSQSI